MVRLTFNSLLAAVVITPIYVIYLSDFSELLTLLLLSRILPLILLCKLHYFLAKYVKAFHKVFHRVALDLIVLYCFELTL